MPDAEKPIDQGALQDASSLLTITDVLESKFGIDALSVAEQQLKVAEDGSRTLWSAVVSALRQRR